MTLDSTGFDVLDGRESKIRWETSDIWKIKTVK